MALLSVGALKSSVMVSDILGRRPGH